MIFFSTYGLTTRIFNVIMGYTKKEVTMKQYKYKVMWKDWLGEEHTKYYVTAEGAINKTVRVFGLYKNGSCIRISDNHKVL